MCLGVSDMPGVRPAKIWIAVCQYWGTCVEGSATRNACLGVSEVPAVRPAKNFEGKIVDMGPRKVLMSVYRLCLQCSYPLSLWKCNCQQMAL